MSMQKLPLDGIKVIELGTHVAVPNATRFMADWGAQVIKVENIKGDEWRIVGRNQYCPILDDENPFFTLQNANKKFISLNLKSLEGKNAMLKLLDSADIFVSNVRLTSLDKLGLSYDTLSERNPGLVYGHFTGYGYEGDDVSKPGFDSVAFWARSGAMIDWGAKGGFPFVAPTAAGDVIAASNLCSGILAALIGRQATGKGSFVSTSLLNSAIWFCGAAVLSTQFGNQYPKDKDRPSNPFGFPYQCGDGEWLMIGVVDYANAYPKICMVLGLENLIGDERFSTIVNVRQNVTEFIPILNQAFMKKNRDEWVEAISSTGIICGKIGHMKDLAQDPQAIANDFVRDVEFPTGNTITMPTVPVHFSEYKTDSYKPSGAIGRDTQAVLQSIGYTEEQIEDARKLGAIR